MNDHFMKTYNVNVHIVTVCKVNDDNQIYAHIVNACIVVLVDDHTIKVYHLHVHKLNIYLVSCNYGNCSKKIKLPGNEAYTNGTDPDLTASKEAV